MLHLNEGIDFTFPPRFPALAPGEVVVLVRNPVSFAEQYPGVTVGEVLEVTTRNARALFQLEG